VRRAPRVGGVAACHRRVSPPAVEAAPSSHPAEPSNGLREAPEHPGQPSNGLREAPGHPGQPSGGRREPPGTSGWHRHQRAGWAGGAPSSPLPAFRRRHGQSCVRGVAGRRMKVRGNSAQLPGCRSPSNGPIPLGALGAPPRRSPGGPRAPWRGRPSPLGAVAVERRDSAGRGVPRAPGSIRPLRGLPVAPHPGTRFLPQSGAGRQPGCPLLYAAACTSSWLGAEFPALLGASGPSGACRVGG
jgi:hypothetical protein